MCSGFARGFRSWLARSQSGWAKTTSRSPIGCDPNAPNEYGYTALMVAARNGRGGVVGALLQHGAAELDAVDDDGWTA